MSAHETQVQQAQQLIGLPEYQFSGDNATVERKCTFLALYREHGSIYHAAKLTPVNRKTVYRWIEHDEQFAEAMDDCKDDAVVELEQSVYRRAFTSDLLAMFVLKAHKPQYRDKVSVDITEVQNQIERMMAKLNLAPRQLQPPATEFIDTGYSETGNEYTPVLHVSKPVLSPQSPSTSAPEQKED